MKRMFLALTALIAILSAAAAYEPPAQGENLFYLSHPELLTGGISTAGGGIQSIIPASGTINPALIGLEERVSVDLGYTAMFNSDYRGFHNDWRDRWLRHFGGSSFGYSQALGTGIVIPTDWANFGGEMEFILDGECMGLGHSFHLKTFASKQIVQNLYVGVGLGAGGEWKYYNDWMLTADVGAVYNFGDVAFMKNFRVAASTNNIGKTINTSYDWQGFPAMFALRAGAAAEFVHTKDFVLGLSVDVTTPLFMNLIIDSGIQFRIKDFIQINSSWEFNTKEVFDGRAALLPTVGIVFKFNIGMGNSDFIRKHDWTKSELCPSAAWKNVDGDINMFGVGAVLRLGQLDDSGPDIEMD